MKGSAHSYTTVRLFYYFVEESGIMNCSSRAFRALMATVFLSVFADNVFRISVCLLSIGTTQTRLCAIQSPLIVISLCILPFLLFSPFAGRLADRFPSARLIQISRLVDLLLVGPAAWFFMNDNANGLLGVFFLWSSMSALFGPAKYKLLVDILDNRSLSKGNGYTEFFTVLGIFVATVACIILAKLPDDQFVPSLLLMTAASTGSFMLSFLISSEGATSKGPLFISNPLKHLRSTLLDIHANQKLFLTLVASIFFWALAGFIQMNLLGFANISASLSDLKTLVLIGSLALGAACGCLIAGSFSQEKVEIGLVPIGALGMAIFCGLLSIASSHYWLMLPSSFLVGISGGIFIIPLNANFQKKCPADQKGRFLGTQNMLAWLAVAISAFVMVFLKDILGQRPALFFLLASLTTLLVAAIILREIPYALIRCAVWAFTHLFYRLKINGLENIPNEGGALLVCNHVSYADPFLIQASVDRPVRFLIYRPIYEYKYAKPIMKVLEAIPVAPEDGPKAILRSLQEARQAIMNGDIVCVFGEGTPTRIGQMLPFKAGFEQIMKGLNAPIIPTYIDNVWGSIFNIENGRYAWNRPKEIPYPATVMFGKHRPPDMKVFAVRQVIQEMGTEAFALRKQQYQLLHAGFIHVAKRNPFSPCMSDASGKKLKYIQVLIASFVLAKKLQKLLKAAEDNVGVLLPTSIAGAITNLALMIAGKVTVNLNFTSGPEAQESCLQQAQIKHIVTSRAFIGKLGVPAASNHIYVEDLFKPPSKAAKIALLLVFLLTPSRLLQRLACPKKISRDSLATIIFSSGTTGIPKGVMLTHGNISSNVQSIYDLLGLRRDDHIVGILPFFHSFGFTAALWLPLLSGLPVAFHYSPLEAETIGKLVQDSKATLILATPTFLLSYTRKCPKEQFQTLRWVVAGGEKMRERISSAFTEKFGITPLEGYGCTELSPVALVNVPDYYEKSIKQKGSRPGAAGHPIPGVAVKIVDPDTLQPLPAGTQGLLIVKGPNVMSGYLNCPEKTAEVIKDGWYLTGDLATLSEDGFVTIVDRISRFSKIGGEMIPHIGIEEAIHKFLNESDQICAVTAIGDDKRGERLIVLTTKDFDKKSVIKGLADAGLPNLWIPRDDSFFFIEQLPVLGSGKLDLMGLKKLAEKLAA